MGEIKEYYESINKMMDQNSSNCIIAIHKSLYRESIQTGKDLLGVQTEDNDGHTDTRTLFIRNKELIALVEDLLNKYEPKNESDPTIYQ